MQSYICCYLQGVYSLSWAFIYYILPDVVRVDEFFFPVNTKSLPGISSITTACFSCISVASSLMSRGAEGDKVKVLHVCVLTSHGRFHLVAFWCWLTCEIWKVASIPWNQWLPPITSNVICLCLLSLFVMFLVWNLPVVQTEILWVLTLFFVCFSCLFLAQSLKYSGN